MLNSISAQYICKNTKKYSEKCLYGWILFAGRTLFNLILYDRGALRDNLGDILNNRKSLMTLMTGKRPETFIYFSDETPSLS